MRRLIFFACPLLFIAAAGDPRALLDAAKNADAAVVRTLIQKKVDVNASEADGMTALHWASRNNDLASARLLLGAGANVKAGSRYGVTPLTLAAQNGSMR